MDLHTEIQRQLEQDPALPSEKNQEVAQENTDSESRRPSDPGSDAAKTPNEPQDPGRYRVENGRISRKLQGKARR